MCLPALPAALPPHGEPPVLPGPPGLPVRPLRPRVHRVRPDDTALPPPLHAGQERLLQAHGNVWRQLAAGDGLRQVGTAGRREEEIKSSPPLPPSLLRFTTAVLLAHLSPAELLGWS